MKVAKIINKTYSEGPGCRFCIWVQGCNHKCKGCFAEDLWDYNKGNEVELTEIINEINIVKDEICGITFLGGEPFDKAEELVKIAKCIHDSGKNVITFTGYTYEQILNSNNVNWKNLIQNRRNTTRCFNRRCNYIYNKSI